MFRIYLYGLQPFFLLNNHELWIFDNFLRATPLQVFEEYPPGW